MDFLAWFKTLIAWFHAPYKFMMIFVFLAGGALFAPSAWQRQMGVWAVVEAYRPLEWLIFLFFFAMLILSLGERWIEDIRENRRVRKRFKHLSAAEKSMVRYITT